MGSRGTTGALLACDKVDRYRPLGAFGKPAYQSHVQLRAMLLAKRGPRFADYFAKPTYDQDLGELRWTAEVPGAARGWHEMAPEEQAQRALDLEVIRSGLMSYAQELRAQGGNQPGGSQAFASLLEQALKVPAQGEFLYFVGEQPVIAFWGFETQGGASIDAAAVAPQYPARTGTTGPAAALTPDAALPLDARKKRPWWWWLLWALLALLLLVALLLVQRTCCTPDVPVGPEIPAPVEEPKVPATAALKPSQELEIPPGALEAGDLSFLEGLWQLGDGRLNEYRHRPENIVATNRTVFQFGRDKGGHFFAVERKDARTAQPLPATSGKLHVYTDGKRVYIDREDGSKHQCELIKGGRTHCYVVNADGVRWNAPLRRLR